MGGVLSYVYRSGMTVLYLAGKDEYHKTAAVEARKILQAWECPGPKPDSKPVSPYWFAKS